MATINGTSGNDTLTNLTSNDDFFGFAGNDVYKYDVGDGDDTITDSAGDDELKFGTGISRYALSLIQSGNDLIVTTAESGSITIVNHFTSSEIETISFDSGPNFDLSGSNIFFTNGPDMYGSYPAIVGTSGDDIAYGSFTYELSQAVGLLSIYTAEGNDIIYCNYAFAGGGEGNDIFYGNGSMFGDDGADVFYLSVYEGHERPWAYGGNGNDIVYGGNDDDAMLGDDGNDLLYGNAGNDTLNGNIGDDTLYGGDGDDILDGDVYIISTSSAGDGAGNDYLDGGEGNDSIATGGGNDLVYGGDGNDNIAAVISDGYFTAAGGNKEMHGGNGDDIIYGGLGNNIIRGDDGNDIIWDISQGGDDILSGGNGNDDISGGASLGYTITINGDAGNDLLTFGTPSAWGTLDIYGGSDNDIYYPFTYISSAYSFGSTRIFDASGSADKFLSNEASTDFTFSVSGTDLILTLAGWAGSITIEDMFVAAHKIESFEFSNKNGSLFETLSNNINSYSATASTSKLGIIHNFIEALGGNDTINANAGNDVVWGGTGGDTLNGNADNDVLYGEDDDDTLRGGTGDDILDGGNNTDTASYSDATSAVTVSLAITTGQAVGGGLGTDTLTNIELLRGSNYADTLTGDANGNSIWGANGNDTIYGGNGNDTLYGDASNDTLYGEDGDDILFGGNNNDTLSGGNGTDTASYANATGSITVSLAIATAQVTGEGTDTLSNIENLTGSNQADTLTGNMGSNVLNGLGGNDTLNGGDGIDLLVGGDGNDILNGGNGNDILHGNQGADDLYGNAGADIFMFDYGTVTSGGIDEIKDFTAGAGGDVINIANVLSGFGYDSLTDALNDWLQLTTSGSDTVFKLDTSGTGSFGAATSILEVDGITSLVLATLVTDGNLIT